MTHTPIPTDEETVGPLAERIFQQILDAIYQGRLAPGTVVNEAALAQEFGVSRGPVREALRRLQGIALVSREPYMKARVVSLSAQTCLELFQMRMALEGVACNLATRRMHDTEIEQISRELEQDHQRSQHGAEPDTANGPASAFDFHEHIVRACGNERIIKALCGDLYHLLRIYRRHATVVLDHKEDTYKEHWQILRAIQARDADLAESLMRSHIERAASHLFTELADAHQAAR